MEPCHREVVCWPASTLCDLRRSSGPRLAAARRAQPTKPQFCRSFSLDGKQCAIELQRAASAVSQTVLKPRSSVGKLYILALTRQLFERLHCLSFQFGDLQRE